MPITANSRYTERTVVNLTPEQRELLEHIAEVRGGVPVSTVVRILLERHGKTLLTTV